ncbi:MAG TPA: ribonuclease P protein component [Candidatus Babeliales bacterium]|jgi:ribonuclease P protein component|nr:ribonuclease P protein component [Candidatus Babeliales bacterium]
MSRITKNISTFTTSEVAQVFEKAQCIFKNAGLTLLSAPAQINHGRILIITPRRIGNAPQRNKIRRQLRAIFYEEKLYDLFFDCVIIVRAAALAYSFDTLKNILLNAFGKKV